MAQLRSIALFTLTLPFAMAATLLAPRFVSTAEGCSGGSPAASWNLQGWHDLKGSDDPTMPSDGVVVLRGMYQSLEAQQALALVKVEVSDSSSAPVAGSLEIIDTLGIPAGRAAARNAAIIWRPSAALAPDSDYTVTWSAGSAAPLAAGSVKLHTVGDKNAAGPASVESTALVEAWVNSGSLVTCANSSYCGVTNYTFFESAEVEPALSVTLVPGNAINTTYQLFELVPVAGKGTPAEPSSRTLHVANGGGGLGVSLVVSQAFSDDASDYCVKLVSTDLRNGSKAELKELCVANGPRAALDSPWLYTLFSCVAPPSADLTPFWCQGSGHSDDAICQGVAGAGGSAGATGGGGLGGAAGAAAGTGGSAGDGNLEPGDGSSGSGCACSAPARQSGSGLWVILVLGAAALGRRFRQRGR